MTPNTPANPAPSAADKTFGDLTQPPHIPTGVSTGEGVTVPAPTPRTDAVIDELANAFLRWPLPESVHSDLCATMQEPGRVGTNLLSFTEAQQMMRDLVGPVLAAKDAEIARLKAQTQAVGSFLLHLRDTTEVSPNIGAHAFHLWRETNLPECEVKPTIVEALTRAEKAEAELTTAKANGQNAFIEAGVQLAKVINERDQLLAWKQSALAVEREWDEQKIAKLLGAPLGSSCREFINKALPALVQERDALRAEVERLHKMCADAQLSAKVALESNQKLRAELAAARQSPTTPKPASS